MLWFKAWERFGNVSLLALEILMAKNLKRLIIKIFGAGGGDRTRDVQLGNFVSDLVIYSFVART